MKNRNIEINKILETSPNMLIITINTAGKGKESAVSSPDQYIFLNTQLKFIFPFLLYSGRVIV